MSAKLSALLGCILAGMTAVAWSPSRAGGLNDTPPAVQLKPQNFDVGLFGVSGAAFSHSGRLVAFLGYTTPNSMQSLAVTVFDARSRRLVTKLPLTNPSWTVLKGGIAFSPDDTRLAAGANEITIWNTETWEEAVRAPGPFTDSQFGADDLIGLAYTPDGQQIVAAYGQVWGPGEVRVRSRDEFVRLSEARRLAYASGKVPDVYERPEIEVFDASTGSRRKRFAIARPGMRGDYSLITSGLVVSEDGRAAYIGVRDMDGLSGSPLSHLTPRITVERLDLDSGGSALVFDRYQDDVFTALAVNADQTLFATGEAVGNKEAGHETADPVRVWSTSDGGLRTSLEPPAGPIRQLLFSPDGVAVIACQLDGRSHNLLAVWNTKTKSLTAVVHIDTPRPSLVWCALSRDGRQAVLTLPTGQAFRNGSRDTAYMVDLPSMAQ